ncbi:CHAP domain-containing protein [Bifidobacterium tissieri]|uniref:CHAP domain-containing protein n=1 Tax=Bifidobacterium tissieri TaxID=1630162 RepID=UPI001239DC41|nr:CHAP domain-containing protein [Bifidobacterium tissieri]KAA8830168.1 CHAP domain-containing protein [Bifidobacterium tissieri]
MVTLLDPDRIDTAGKLTTYTSRVRSDMGPGTNLRTHTVDFSKATTGAAQRVKGALNDVMDDQTDSGDVEDGIASKGRSGLSAIARRKQDRKTVAKGRKTVAGVSAPDVPAGATARRGLRSPALPSANLGRNTVSRSARRTATAKTGTMGGRTLASGKTVTTAQRTAGRLARSVHAMVTAIGKGITAMMTSISATVGIPVALVTICVLVVVALVASLLFWLPDSAAQRGCSGTRTEAAIPEGAEPWVTKAAETSGLPPEFIAAMMTIESGFRPDTFSDDVNGGTWGLLQLNREVWRGVHPDGADAPTPEGITDPMTHAEYGGRYLGQRLEHVRQLQAAHPDMEFSRLDELEALVVAHNAGEANLMRWPDIPDVTATYLDKMKAMTGNAGSCMVTGSVVGVLDPPLVMNGDDSAVNVDVMQLPAAPSYERWQCTWWAASRRSHIGKPVDAYMGNGHAWRDSAVRLGYPMDKSPRPGDVMVFQRGVLGSSRDYGHVAIVEEVNDDGRIILSESGATLARVILRTLTPQQLEANRDGIDFIH